MKKYQNKDKNLSKSIQSFPKHHSQKQYNNYTPTKTKERNP